MLIVAGEPYCKGYQKVQQLSFAFCQLSQG